MASKNIHPDTRGKTVKIRIPYPKGVLRDKRILEKRILLQVGCLSTMWSC
jgi:hypothetical protein